jgi:hypothetical protein
MLLAALSLVCSPSAVDPPAGSATGSSPALAASVDVQAKLDPSSPHFLIYPPIANWNVQQGNVVVDILVGIGGWVLMGRF